MNIGIIVFSQTGHTHSVALKLQEKLSEAGHSATVEQVEISGEARPGATDFQIKTAPDVAPYDVIVFAGQVQAFSLSAGMKNYLSQIGALQGKKVALLVTKQLPFYWTGGNRAVNTMKKICESKGGVVCGSGIIIWGSKRREEMINEVIDKLSRLILISLAKKQPEKIRRI
jgi:flavodoxin